MVINDYAHASGVLGSPVGDGWLTLAIEDCVAALRKVDGRTWEAHISVPKGQRGHRALRAFREMMAWFWANVECDRLVAVIRKSRRDATSFVAQLGFRRQCVAILAWPGGAEVETVIAFKDRPA